MTTKSPWLQAMVGDGGGLIEVPIGPEPQAKGGALAHPWPGLVGREGLGCARLNPCGLETVQYSRIQPRTPAHRVFWC